MNGSFWSNTVWFLLLGAATITELVFVLKKAADKKRTISLILIISGLTFVFEVIVCCFLKAYTYYPMLIPASAINDKLAGNLFSQFAITVTGLLLAVYELNLFWYILSSLAFVAIELLFLKLGIYTHNWWRVWMTLGASLFMFLLTKKAYDSDFTYRTNAKRMISMTLGLYTLHMPTVWWIQIITGVVTLNTGIFRDEMNSYAFICLVNLYLMMAGCMFLYFSPQRWGRKVVIIPALYLLVFIADRTGMIHIKEGCFLLLSSLDIWGMYLFVYILDKIIPEAAAGGQKKALAH